MDTQIIDIESFDNSDLMLLFKSCRDVLRSRRREYLESQAVTATISDVDVAHIVGSSRKCFDLSLADYCKVELVIQDEFIRLQQDGCGRLWAIVRPNATTPEYEVLFDGSVIF